MKEVYQWLQSDQKDYNKGVELLAAHCTNKFLVNTFLKSSAQFSLSKLIVELKKVLGMPIADIAMNKPLPVMDFGFETDSIINQDKTINPPVLDPTDDIPSIIKDAKNIYSQLRLKIQDFNEALFNLGTSNTEDVVIQRGKLLNERNQIIPLSEKIYLLKEEYFLTKVIPEDLEGLLKVAAGEKEIEPPKDLPIEEEIKAMTDLDLHKRKSNIVTQTNRYRNQLEYQQDRKGETPNPMPAGPKREKKEKQIEALKNEMNLIIVEIERRKP